MVETTSSAEPGVTATGFGRVLVALYAVMAVGACSRSVVQVATRFGEAPIAYALSAFAAVVYVLATVGLARRGPGARRLATVACTVELVGVLAVGTFTVVVPSDFPDATVWSLYGMGYVFIPLVLPVLGLWWLRRTRSTG
ncbi:hypothetical protein [Kineosporia sp. R_H_3]|uniref:hypothetical protein n=1 Tax=Kineosporia sp. R_H_3 TaxID=1961848 RepID=UPI000B4B6A1F|nr:hypothetical protein [Kineosporia sp. R_H_3]